MRTINGTSRAEPWIMLARAHSACLIGIESFPLVVEAQLTKGLPGFDLVGLPDRSARECIVRVKAALTASGFELPPRHIVVNVAPSEVRKTSPGLDLPVALAVLGAIGVVPDGALADRFVLGELSLGGAIRAVPGGLAQVRGAAARGLASALLSPDQRDASLACGIERRGAPTLVDAVMYLRGKQELDTVRAPDESRQAQVALPELEDVVGQEGAKRALVIAAAGNHAILLCGAPGTGKTMLARRLVGLLPAPSDEDALTIATIASAAGLPSVDRRHRPFRAPHHTASASAIVGGGDPIRPGEITLAHGGVLFLDELPEFRRDALECLRTTMEQAVVTVVRAHGRATMPASPLVVGAMNPCPCGYLGDPKRLCVCTPDKVDRYRSRISGPILDRFDLHVSVPRIAAAAFTGAAAVGGSSADVRAQIDAARETLASRRGASAESPRELVASLAPDAARMLERAVDRLGLSGRVHTKLVRVARTIAALSNSTTPSAENVAEALVYRGFDRTRSSAPTTSV